LNSQEIESAARLLTTARQQRSRIDRLPAVPCSVAEAHAIQDAITASLGWPVGAFKANAPKDGEANRGIIYQRLIHPSPACITAAEVTRCGVEGEVAFVFRHDFPARTEAYARAEVAAGVDALAAIEVIDSRFTDPDPLPALEKLADSFGNGAFVSGEPLDAWRRLNLAALTVSLSVNGTTVLEQQASHPTGDPLQVAVALVNMMRAAGGVTAGPFVTTGSCTGVRYLQPGDRCTVHFEGLGSVDLTFQA
jgi:2-keto-4-pentenoate hydratase